MDLLIEGGTIVTVDKRREIIEDGALPIHRGRIVAAGKKRARFYDRVRVYME